MYELNLLNSQKKKIRVGFHVLYFGKGFLDMTPEVQAQKKNR